MNQDEPTPPPDAPVPAKITVKPLGTIILHGTATIRDIDGNVITPPVFKQPGVIKFCGCGRSGNKPFCDGSHKKIGGLGD